MRPTTPILTLQGLTVRAGGRAVAENVACRVAVGVPTVLLGPTAAGKTALLRALTGGAGDFEISGEMLLGGAPVTAEHHVSLVVRRPQLLSGTIAEAVDPEGRKGAVQVVLHALGLHDFLHPLTRPMLELSPFEVRLAMLVREAVARPLVAAFDEPTYGLTESERALYCKTLRALAKRIGVLVATRSPAVAEALEGVVVELADGQVIAISEPPADGDRRIFVTCESFAPAVGEEEGAPVAAPSPPTPGRATAAYGIPVVDPKKS